MRLRSTASPRVGTVVLLLLSTLVGNVGAQQLGPDQGRCDEYASCSSSTACANKIITSTETYYATIWTTGPCSCGGRSFSPPVYQKWADGLSYYKFLYYSCTTSRWGTEITSGSVMYHDAGSSYSSTYMKQCPGSNSASCFASPAPPPPAPAPPPSPLTTRTPAPKTADKTVVLTLTASGSVSDYSDPSSLRRSIITVAGFSSTVITVAAASVIITATITVPASAATAVQMRLSSSLGTAAAASAALGITVQSAPTVTISTTSSYNYWAPSSPPPPPHWGSSGSNTTALSGERSKGLQVGMYVLAGILGLIGLTLLVLLVVSCFTKKAKTQPTRAGMPNVNGAAGWGPYGFLFPKSWVYVWWGYLAMVAWLYVWWEYLATATGMVTRSETIETILSVGPCIHCVLMPFLWTHKHREVKKRIENQGGANVVATSELDPEAKTVIFSMKLGCGSRCTVLLADLTMGLVEFGLWVIKRGSLGTINLNAFWFPSPFYTFWKAKMRIGLFQIRGAKICTTANQSDAYMKFVTEAMLNFWTLGIYGKCCKGRTSYGRWLDRHVLWQGTPPRGYNNRELAPLELLFPPHAPPPRLATTPTLAPRQSFGSSTRSSPSPSWSRYTWLGCCSTSAVGSSR